MIQPSPRAESSPLPEEYPRELGPLIPLALPPPANRSSIAVPSSRRTRPVVSMSRPPWVARIPLVRGAA